MKQNRKTENGSTEDGLLTVISYNAALFGCIWLSRKILSPGARFSKLPVIIGPVKLFYFPFQMGVSKDLNIILSSY